jgi:hypothetical protein
VAVRQQFDQFAIAVAADDDAGDYYRRCSLLMMMTVKRP